ncbi:MAG: ATP-binding protein, partial [Myxococcota bacterium]
VITVEDNAAGMTHEQAQRSFHRFHSERVGGTGLGLPYCKETIAAMGGFMRLQAKPGEYVKVSVLLKQQQPPKQGANPHSGDEEFVSVRQQKLMQRIDRRNAELEKSQENKQGG